MVHNSAYVWIVAIGVRVPREQQIITGRVRVGELKVVRATGHSFSGETRLQVQTFNKILCIIHLL